MAWDPDQYLKFADDRRRPAIDLMMRVALDAPRAIVDLGCGAGNVTRLLGERWPDAEIVGVDSSPAMLAAARETTRDDRRFEWVEADVSTWVPGADQRPDLVYSNAALQWLDAHATLMPRLLSSVADGGVLAVQMPDNFSAPSHVSLYETANSPRWNALLAPRVRPSPVARADVYYRWLAPLAARLDIWTTEYLHVLPPGADGEHPIVAWTSSTALTPFTSVLGAQQAREFVDDYRARVAPLYPPQPDGRVLFPFRRHFIVAVRSNR